MKVIFKVRTEFKSAFSLHLEANHLIIVEGYPLCDLVTDNAAYS
jgi:hypothetical protein